MQVQIEYFGVRASGKNLTEARRNAGEIIEKELKEDYSPRYMVVADYVLFLYREPLYGWTYQIISKSENKPLARFSSGLGFDDTLEECEKHARHHLAQYLLNPKDRTSLTKCLAVLKDTRDLKEFPGYAEWQFVMRELLDSGMENEAARHEADRRMFSH